MFLSQSEGFVLTITHVQDYLIVVNLTLFYFLYGRSIVICEGLNPEVAFRLILHDETVNRFTYLKQMLS